MRLYELVVLCMVVLVVGRQWDSRKTFGASIEGGDSERMQ
jgi:hypothetical protein